MIKILIVDFVLFLVLVLALISAFVGLLGFYKNRPTKKKGKHG